jgi:hypothetical protein
MPIDPFPDEMQVIIDYAWRRFAEERYPLSPSLQPVREALDRLCPRPQPDPLPPSKPHVPTLAERRNLTGSASFEPTRSIACRESRFARRVSVASATDAASRRALLSIQACRANRISETLMFLRLRDRLHGSGRKS